nr:hypothetical protein [Mycobacterium uberis]
MFRRPFRARNNRDFMWNSGVFDVKTNKARWSLHAAAGRIFTTHPFFLKLGQQLGRML